MSVRTGRRIGALLFLTVAVGVGWWAGRVTFAPPVSDAPESSAPATVQVVTGSVGQVLNLSAAAVTPYSQVATNGLGGVVTAVGDGHVDMGSVLYEVAGVPVRAVVGSVPFYRDLTSNTRGEDVVQLQGALVALGYLEGELDGHFGNATSDAVRVWQRAEAHPVTGTVTLGELIAVPALPDVVRLGDAITLGSVLTGGESAVSVRSKDPSFELVVSQDQASLIQLDSAVSVTLGDATWSAVVAAARVEDGGQVVLALSAPDGSLVCGDQCHVLPPSERTLLSVVVHVVPEVVGAVVPAAAVETDASGAAFVRTETGELIPVEVIASGRGQVVVSGIEVGTRILALAVPATT